MVYTSTKSVGLPRAPKWALYVPACSWTTSNTRFGNSILLESLNYTTGISPMVWFTFRTTVAHECFMVHTMCSKYLGVSLLYFILQPLVVLVSSTWTHIHYTFSSSLSRAATIEAGSHIGNTPGSRISINHAAPTTHFRMVSMMEVSLQDCMSFMHISHDTVLFFYP